MDPVSNRDKPQLRRQALAARDALAPGLRIEASYAIADRAEALIPRETAIVAGYLPIRSEVDPRPLMMRLKDRRLRLCVPAILPNGHIEFRELLPGGALVPQGLGTVAPDTGTPVLRPDVVLVPLAAFDHRCHRIGYGRGFYDRAIEALREDGRGCLAIGLAFVVQAIVHVPDAPGDAALDAVVTEAATIRPAR